jgi:hypothetical protein
VSSATRLPRRSAPRSAPASPAPAPAGAQPGPRPRRRIALAQNFLRHPGVAERLLDRTSVGCGVRKPDSPKAAVIG